LTDLVALDEGRRRERAIGARCHGFDRDQARTAARLWFRVIEFTPGAE